MATVPSDDPSPPSPVSDRVRLRRQAGRGSYAPDDVTAVLDAGLVAHVGVSTPDGPIVLPMAYGRTDEVVYLHGASANALLGSAAGTEVCVTVTLIDGLVIGRSAFHNSMNYRSAVVRGVAREVVGDEKVEALRIISDHVVPTWDSGRPTTDGEVRRTSVVAVPLAESSAKVRTGGPVDEPEDLDGPWWAGQIPVETRFGPAVPEAALDAAVTVPARIEALRQAAR
jgi:uncharacterized protein